MLLKLTANDASQISAADLHLDSLHLDSLHLDLLHLDSLHLDLLHLDLAWWNPEKPQDLKFGLGGGGLHSYGRLLQTIRYLLCQKHQIIAKYTSFNISNEMLLFLLILPQNLNFITVVLDGQA